MWLRFWVFRCFRTRARLSRPLDFLVLTDHAEMYGLMPQLLKGNTEILRQEQGRKWYESTNGRRL